MNNHWYLVAHRAGARIFEQTGIKPELRLAFNFENPEGKLKDSELVSDRQGRADHSSIIGHSPVGNDKGPRDQVVFKFAQELAEFLEKEANRKTFASLVLVAEPNLLGELRKALGQETVKCLRDSLSKDLVHVSDRDMAEHIKSVFCAQEPITTH